MKIETRHYKPKIEKLSRKQALHEWLRDDRIKGYLVTKMFRRSIFLQINKPLEFSFMEDSYLVLCALDISRSVIVNDASEYYYRMNPQSSVHANFKQSELVAIDVISNQMKKIFGVNDEENDLMMIHTIKMLNYVIEKMTLKECFLNRETLNNFTELIGEQHSAFRQHFRKIEALLLPFCVGPLSSYFIIKLIRQIERR